jgi:hypothetical protein
MIIWASKEKNLGQVKKLKYSFKGLSQIKGFISDQN